MRLLVVIPASELVEADLLIGMDDVHYVYVTSIADSSAGRVQVTVGEETFLLAADQSVVVAREYELEAEEEVEE